jgi:ATP-binding cassette, subfamily F, member 3
MAIQIKNVSKAFGDRVVLEGIDLYLSNGDRAGLIGPNGCGKTTLVRIIAGQEDKDSGTIDIPKEDFTLGYLEQFTGVHPDATLMDEALTGAEKIYRLETKMRALEERMGSEDHEEVMRATSDYEKVLAQFEHAGGYTFETEVKSILTGLGFRESDWSKPAEGLSGGERTRLALSRLLAEKPDFILLDEPTNHLDLPAIEWLESTLRGFDGGYLVISHDRRFLDACCPILFEIEGGKIYRYTGGYQGFLEQKAERLERERKMLERRQEEIRQLKEFVARWSKDKRRASQATSRQRKLDKLEMDPVEITRREKAGMNLRFEESVRSFDEVITVRSLGKRFDNVTLFQNLSFSVRQGERLAIIGRNGTGKTTLLRMMAGEIEPSSGEIWWGDRTMWAYFSQTMSELDLDNTVHDEFSRLSRNVSGQEARNLLGRFLFSGDDIAKRVGDLSGGERSKLMLAVLLTRRPNCLVLDEPTNHLDLPSREVLEEALGEFHGTLIFVSHDRAFIDRLATHTLELKDGEAKMYVGNYSDVIYRQQEMRRAKEEAERDRRKEELDEERREKSRARRRKGKKDLSEPETDEPGRLMDEIELIEAQIVSLEEELCQPEIYMDYGKAAELNRAIKEKKVARDMLFKRLEQSLGE